MVGCARCLRGSVVSTEKETEEFIELVKQIRNRCEVLLLLLNTPAHYHLVYTIAEDMIHDALEIAEKYCAEKEL